MPTTFLYITQWIIDSSTRRRCVSQVSAQSRLAKDDEGTGVCWRGGVINCNLLSKEMGMTVRILSVVIRKDQKHAHRRPSLQQTTRDLWATETAGQRNRGVCIRWKRVKYWSPGWWNLPCMFDRHYCISIAFLCPLSSQYISTLPQNQRFISDENYPTSTITSNLNMWNKFRVDLTGVRMENIHTYQFTTWNISKYWGSSATDMRRRLR